MKQILRTERLLLRELNETDADFMLCLLNTPSWLQYIGDRQVRTMEDARNYIINGPVKSYRENNFGLWAMTTAKESETVGICGLIRRPGLEDADIGFALLPEYEGKGFALEAAAATLYYAKEMLRLPRVVAITAMDNLRSISLLEKIGLRFEKTVKLPGDDEELNLFVTKWTSDKY